eukprot:TRINITY_DN1525_c0_g1_i1.p1 TRINITY_DN1525_c0_g1~~TRINITY_DN1525_c0_g1_i1.p1  ORF type:complete len:608 (+),score=36.09 TRINITY_DN1525_c0_g1_i1:754-2577(+)
MGGGRRYARTRLIQKGHSRKSQIWSSKLIRWHSQNQSWNTQASKRRSSRSILPRWWKIKSRRTSTCQPSLVFLKKDILIEEWGELLKQRAAPWGKRIQLLHRIQIIVQTHKKAHKELKEKVEKEQNKEEKEKMEAQLKSFGISLQSKLIENYDNLLNFLPSSVFYGQRPSLWWTKRHDIDLIVGTYKYGYANYQLMRADTSLSFHKLEGTYQEFPNADTITRRLKKLIQTIVKEQHNLHKLNFTESAASEDEPTGWSLEEKNHILELVADFGIPITAEGKNDWSQLREKLFQRLFGEAEPEKEKKSAIEEKGVQLLEKFVQRLRIYSQQLLENPTSTGNFDPDNDGFVVSPEMAQQLYTNLNLLIFVRKHLLAANAKTFNAGLSSLTENMEKYTSEKHGYLPAGWTPAIHDKGLLYAVSENGLSFLSELSDNKQYGFEGIVISEEDARRRLEFLCDFYRDFAVVTKVAKKRKAPEKSESKPATTEKPKKKQSKVLVERDEEGNIVYPIAINPSLTIWSLGRIEYEKPGYHNEKYHLGKQQSFAIGVYILQDIRAQGNTPACSNWAKEQNIYAKYQTEDLSHYFRQSHPKILNIQQLRSHLLPHGQKN